MKKKGVLVKALIAGMVLSSILVLPSCIGNASDELPSTHVTSQGDVNTADAVPAIWMEDGSRRMWKCESPFKQDDEMGDLMRREGGLNG